MGTDDDLRAVWGPEATARAIAARDAMPPDGPGPEPAPAGPAPGRRRGWGRMRTALVGTALVGAAAVAVGVVVVGADGSPAPGPGLGATAADAATEDDAGAEDDVAGAVWAPTWEVDLACPSLPVADDAVEGVCPVAVDDERAYVLEERDEETWVSARAVADGAERWAVARPEASHLERFPALVVVWGEDTITALDPVRGTVRWEAVADAAWPVGRDRVLVDRLTNGPEGRTRTRMALLDAVDGREVTVEEGWAEELFVHTCGPSGMVLVSADGRLVGRDADDGRVLWDVAAPHHDAFDPLLCADDVIVAVEDGDLIVRSAGSGRVTASLTLVGDEGFARVLGVVGTTAVVATDGAVHGYRTTGIDLEWDLLDLTRAGSALVAAAGDGLGVVVPGEVAVGYGADGEAGLRLDLGGLSDAVAADGTLVAWGSQGLVVAALADIGGARRAEPTRVRRAAVAGSVVVATTPDRLVAYPWG